MRKSPDAPAIGPVGLRSRNLRPALSAYLHQRVRAMQDGFRHNLAVLGPLGSGKSTLLQHVLQTSEAKLIKISCTFQRDSVREFLRRFSAAMLRGGLRAPAEAPLEALLPQASALLPNTAAAIQRLDRYATGHHHAEALVRALDVIPVLHQELGQPCVLVFDEFLHLEELGFAHAFHELGKRVMTWPFALFMMTSSSTYRAQDILRERLHLLFGQFELITLGAMETPAAMAWIQEELSAGAERDAAVSQFLFHWMGTSPWHLGVVLNRMKELALLRCQRRLGDALVIQAAWDVLGSSDGALYHWCDAQVERVVHQRHGPIAREALIHLARGAKTTQAVAAQAGSRRNLSSAMQLLVEQDLIQRKGACWVIPDQVLSCWIAAVLGPRQQDGVRARETGYPLFEAHLKTLWAQWQEASTQPLADRISRLFSKFRNETVSLDHKTGRLPAFSLLQPQRSAERGPTYIIADGEERRWCCLIHEAQVGEADIAAFEQFCRAQAPRPSRKVVVSREGVDVNATLLAKEASMWVWGLEDVNLLCLLYGQPTLSRS